MKKNIDSLIRKNILQLSPYSCARDEFKGEAAIFLDANENPYNNTINRYPDPLQQSLKQAIAQEKGVPTEQIFLGNGSDEAIDLIYRIFCEPASDNVIAIEPTYGMYKVCADINNVHYKTAQLTADFQIESQTLLSLVDSHTKVIWLCSPNNPTGNLLHSSDIEHILNTFDGIVVVDEAYIDFASTASWSTQLALYPNLIVLQTLSKAWGCAAIRLGMAFASPDIIATMNKVKYPYNINLLTQERALQQLRDKAQFTSQLESIIQQRSVLAQNLQALPIVEKVYPSDANFLLVKVKDANATYQYLAEQGAIVRNRHNITLCSNCLRITVGLASENEQLLHHLARYSQL